MPARNRVKTYVEGGIYHVYNRGVERRRIFIDDEDFTVFLQILSYYLSKPQSETDHPLDNLNGFGPVRKRPLATLHGEVEVLCYCLMPNHFHLMIRQKSIDGMTRLLQKVLTTYSIYFNRRHERVGHLFQGPYKAVLVGDDNQLLHLSRYIHQNPTLTKRYLNQYPFSSYGHYIGEKKNDWLRTDFVLSFFQRPKSDALGLSGFHNYKTFVEEYEQEPKEILGRLTFEEE